jgi:integrase
MNDHALYLRFVETTERLLGAPLPPHMMRDCVASDLALVSEEHIYVAQDLLTHRTRQATERYYIHGQQRRASRAVNLILKGIRSSMR